MKTIFPDQLWDSEENRDIGFVSAIDLFIHHIDIEKDTLSYIFDKEVKTFEDQEKNETRFRAREFEIRHHLKDDLDPIATTLAIMENLRIFFNDHPYAFKYLHEHLTGRDAEYTPWGNPKRAQIDYVPTYTKYARNQELSTQEDILVGIGQEVTGLSTIEDILAALPPKSKKIDFIDTEISKRFQCPTEHLLIDYGAP